MSDQTNTPTPENVTFEEGYDELKRIVGRLGADDVSVHEMFEGFRRGKGLEKSLRAYLAEREGELTEIEQGHNLPEFNIVAPVDPDANATLADDPGSNSDWEKGSSAAAEEFQAQTAADTSDVQGQRSPAMDDDIPF